MSRHGADRAVLSQIEAYEDAAGELAELLGLTTAGGRGNRSRTSATSRGTVPRDASAHVPHPARDGRWSPRYRRTP